MVVLVKLKISHTNSSQLHRFVLLLMWTLTSVILQCLPATAEQLLVCTRSYMAIWPSYFLLHRKMQHQSTCCRNDRHFCKHWEKITTLQTTRAVITVQSNHLSKRIESLSESPWNNLDYPVFDGVRLADFKSRATSSFLADSALYHFVFTAIPITSFRVLVL